MQESPIELHQFSHSHFNEKVRWTLDYKDIPHVRINYIPGPHALQIRRLTGQTQVPVLRIDGRAVAGSAAIIDLIERQFPAPPLYPADANDRAEALSLQEKFDATLGPELRRAVFDACLDAPDFIVATFASEKPVWKQRAFRAAFPLVRTLMQNSMNITPETGRRAKERVDETLDYIAGRVARTGYLVGDTFTVADLTAAALLGPVALVHHPDMKQAEPLPPRVATLCVGWSEHPGLIWANDMWRKHRPPRKGVVIS
ncbi:MAG TPA: glutathione S-transferase family protein [Candidatus Binatia bacterium]|jgi:glutathione S-transferase